MPIFTELLDLPCEHHYMFFLLNSAAYFKNIFCRNLIQQQMCLKDFRSRR